MHVRCGKCITGFSKKLKLRTPFEGLSVDCLTVLQVTLNKHCEGMSWIILAQDRTP
jgi:hypothetical protein